jgi:riboflavin kinase
LEKIKPVLIPTLVELVKLRAHLEFVPLSTEELADRLGQSQQAASQHLQELEKLGFVERRRSGAKFAIKLTGAGQDIVRAYYSSLKVALDGKPKEMRFIGKVFPGLGEGAYYIGLEGYKTQLAKALGFDPYAGTLNLRLEGANQAEQKRQLRGFDGLRIEGFQRDGRTYGGARCYRATVGKGAGLPAAVLVIDRTHYDDSVLEIVSPHFLRGALGLKDGDLLDVNVVIS